MGTHQPIVIFDLDGTLIDSAPSVLASCQAAFEATHIVPVRTMTQDLIGPPLRVMLSTLCAADDLERMDELAAAFMAHYDTVGYRSTQPIAGTDAMLRALFAADVPLMIATNKRQSPTHLIIEHFGWTSMFKRIYALDTTNPPLKDKATLLRWIVAQHGLARPATLYVGDRDEDREAAHAAGLEFLMVPWGYGGHADPSGVTELPALTAYIQAWHDAKRSGQ